MRAPLASARAGGLAGRPCAGAPARVLAACAQRAGRGGAGGGGMTAPMASARTGGPAGRPCAGATVWAGRLAGERAR